MMVADLEVGQTVVFDAVPVSSSLNTDQTWKVEFVSMFQHGEVILRNRFGFGVNIMKVRLSAPEFSFYRATC